MSAARKFKEIESHPNFPKLEEETLRFWEEEKIFEKSLALRRASRGKKSRFFTFYDGPPFATGLPHYGHILASTIKDVIPRYQSMKGKYVRRRWGWDCHGLPIEEIVERKLKISGKKEIEKIGIKKFNETCRSEVLKYVKEWGKMVKRLARWVEFDNSYKTMDRDYMESVWWAFKEIYKKGLVYEGRKVLLYCPRCETPISNFEVAMDNSYKTITEESVTVKFKIHPPSLPPLLRGGKGEVYLLAWTTTPWTLPGNTQLYVGQDLDYVVVEKEGKRYILASQTKAQYPSLSNLQPIQKLKANELIGLEYESLYNIKEIKSPASYKVSLADFVSTEEGTGIVHSAVVHGEEDYEMGLKQGLPVVPLLDEKGQYNQKAPKFLQGQYFKSAERDIKNDLEKRDLLFFRQNHTHSYPHCWRCETPLFYFAIPAWFINVQKLKNKLIKSNTKEINWYPEHLKHGRYEKSVEQAPDWNISRNRYWGNPIPVWQCEKCAKDTVVGSIEELQGKAVNLDVIASGAKPSQNQEIAARPSGPRNDESLIDSHRPDIDEVILKCEHCGGEAKRITEIFDSWFEAASMPFAEYHYPFENKKVFESRFPAQFVTEYIAQTRAWFYVMHVVSLILFDHAPFENVVTTGTILNEKGEKLSKSRKNFPDPWEIINQYGVDSLRFYLMSSVVMQADYLFFNVRDLEKIYRKVILILWNVYNYFVTYANQINRPKKAEPMVLDEWAGLRTQELINEVSKYLDHYDTVRATRIMETYINDLSTWYLRRSRGREDQAFFETLKSCLVVFSKVSAPFMPYISEEIYKNLSGKESVHLADWPKVKKLTAKQTKLLQEMAEVRKIVEEVHALRAKAEIKLRQPLSKLMIPKTSLTSPLMRGEKKGVIEILKEEINVLEVSYGPTLELDTKITSGLKIAGLTRELERQIQQFRKESGLKIGELADLYWETNSAKIKQVLQKLDRKKIYVKTLKQAQGEKPAAFRKEMEVEGEKIKISLQKISNF